MGPVLSLRRQIQDDPLVEKALALRLKELKKIYKHYTINNQFTFRQSALSLFEMKGEDADGGAADTKHFWHPLTS